MATYRWNSDAWSGYGSITPAGYSGAFSPGALGAPGAGSKLVKCAMAMRYTLVGENPSVSITPDWGLLQEGDFVLAVQSAGDATVPSPYTVEPTGYKVRGELNSQVGYFGALNSQQWVNLQSGGLIWSSGEDRTPPADGLQVRPGFEMIDGSGGIAIFGSAFRWHYHIWIHALWLD